MNQDRLTGIRAIFFDFDGVLFNFEPIHFLGWQKLLESKKIKTFSLSLSEFIGVSDTKIALDILQSSSLNETIPDLIQQKNQFVLHEINQLSINIDAIKETLDYFVSHLLLAIVSSSSQEFIRPILKKYHLDTFFSFIVGSDEVSQHKPHPLPYLYALQKTPFMPHEVVAVEDSEPGLAAAQAAGLPVIWYIEHLNMMPSTHSSYPICSSFQQLKQLIN